MEQFRLKVSSIFKLINKLENILLAATIIGMVLVIMIQILGRITGRPFPWTEESSRYLFLWMMFIALAAGFNRCESSRVTLLVQMCPKWLKKFCEILYFLFVESFFIFMIVYGLQVVQQQILFNEMGAALRIPMYLIGVCQPIGGALGFIGTLESFLQHYSKVRIGDKEEEKQKALENG